MTEWVPVAEGPGEKAVEIETEDDGTLLVSAVAAHFPGTTTLKYNGPTGAERAVKLTDDQKLKPPSTGWESAKCYYTVNPVREAQKKKEQIELQMKRKAEVQQQLAGGGVEPSAKSARWDQQGPAGEYGGGASNYPMQNLEEMRDLILLGMLPTTTEQQVRQYFTEQGAELALCQMKKSKDQQTGYAFIRFHEKGLETTMRRQKHIIDGRDCTLKIPDSRQADGGERGEKKVYVSYQDSSLTKEELRTHFEQFGSVEDVFIPTPWRYFAFVTFDDARVAQGLIGKEHNVRGVSLLMKRGQKPGTRAEPHSSMPGGGRFGGNDYGYGRGRDDRGRSQDYISYPNQYGGGSDRGYGGDSKPPLPPTPGADPAYAAWYAQYGHLSAQNHSQQSQYQSFLQQTGQSGPPSGPPGDDKPPGTEDSAVDARTASYNAYMQYAYQQWMASQAGQSGNGYNNSSRDSYNSSGNGSGGGPPGAPGGPKYGPPVPGTNYAAMGYSYDNGRDNGPPKSPPRGGFGDRGDGGSRRAFRN